MTRYLAGGVAALLLAGAGIFFWQSRASDTLPGAPPVAAQGLALPALGDPQPEPPKAAPGTREQKRFGRLDKDKNAQIDTDEYFASRRKAFLKLDANNDGRLSFDEWAIKAREKFAKADADRSGILNAAEFATTAVVRKAKPKAKCDCPAVKVEGEDGD